MNVTNHAILERLQRLEANASPPARYLVAFSGGVDSTVLLHALATTRNTHKIPLVAVHVDHGLHDESARWEAHCRQVAEDLGVGYESRAVSVATDAGASVEAAAREARYGVLRGLMRPDDWLLSAHHEDDQAETLLLNLFRGSGVSGLAGIGRIRAFGGGRLVRPLLGFAAAGLVRYAEQHGLHWLDDPSNADTRFDRNFLRAEILPALAARWPAVRSKITQSAQLAGEASELLRDLAGMDLAALGDANRLQIAALGSISSARQRNVLRYAIASCGLPPAPATRLHQVVNELLPARADGQPIVAWPGGEVRRYRESVYILAPQDADISSADITWEETGDALELGAGQGRLELCEGAHVGLSPQLLEQDLHVRYRAGGEEIRPFGQDCRYKLKKLLQQRSIVPWMRGRIPLLYADEQLLAVADLWLASDAATEPGLAVRWHNAPALY